MPRLSPRSTPLTTHALGSAAVARARLSSTLTRDRDSLRSSAPASTGAPAGLAQTDLLDLLLSQAAGTPRGRS